MTKTTRTTLALSGAAVALLLAAAVKTDLFDRPLSMLNSMYEEQLSAVIGAVRRRMSPPDRSWVGGPYKSALTTVFWAGESADEDNGYISNAPSAWDSKWSKRYGGIDDPEDRCGHVPCAFTPKENSFYFALPYNDLDDRGKRKESARLVPWYEEKRRNKTILKNAWIEIRHYDKTCYAQWQDVGPFEEDDFDYVFGTSSEPANAEGLKAGLDISPAVRDCLGMTGNGVTLWRFTAEETVPEGPWKQTVTDSPARW